jgi:hypothetical protein
MALYAMLADTAGDVGNVGHAREFHANAQRLLSSYYGQNDIYVACKYFFGIDCSGGPIRPEYSSQKARHYLVSFFCVRRAIPLEPFEPIQRLPL